MLPRIKIFFENGLLNQVAPSPDGTIGFVGTGATVVDGLQLATPYIIRGTKDLVALKVIPATNPTIYKFVTEFYLQGGEGLELWIMAVPDTVTLTQMADLTLDYAQKLVNAANGKLRGIFLSRTPAVGYTPTITTGIDQDVITAMAKAQLLGNNAADVKYAPLFVIFEGYAYDGNAVQLKDLTELTYNRVAVMIGDTVTSSKKAALGILAGRIASIQVQRNIGRVKDGPIVSVEAFILDKTVELTDVTAIHDKGYITFRTFVGRSGYFLSDDHMAALPDDDYNHLTARRTIDKAARIAYASLIEELLDEVPVNIDGTLQAPLVKSWQAKVEKDIANGMTAFGELSADITNVNDKGVVCYINANQNVINSSKIDVTLRVRPFGYNRYTDVYLGFQIQNA